MTQTSLTQTSLTAAAARAAHPIVDQEPFVFTDPLPAALLGLRADELIDYHRQRGGHPVLAGARAQVTFRSRYTEELVAARRPDQYVVLGAGLDSFAYRASTAARVYEVDRPDAQRDKRRRLAAAGIAEPAAVRYVPVDFERHRLADSLRQHGFEAETPAVVSCLGVSMYLTREALGATLRELAGFVPGTEVVLDYLVPAPLQDADGRIYADAVGPVSAERGEPWLTLCTPHELAALADGFGTIVHIGQHDRPWLRYRPDALRPSSLARLAHLTVAG
jgi:methyltransferase (TIGR00027 family)